MSKKISYPAVQQPTSKQDITKSYMEEYYAFEVRTGKITKEALEKWIAIIEKTDAEYPSNPVKAFNVKRDKFVATFFPELNAKKEKSSAAFYKGLLDKAEK
jgi:hypothetical protein